jgi:hypothetical protein
MPYETNRDLGLSSGAFDQIQHSTGAALAFGSPIPAAPGRYLDIDLVSMAITARLAPALGRHAATVIVLGFFNHWIAATAEVDTHSGRHFFGLGLVLDEVGRKAKEIRITHGSREEISNDLGGSSSTITIDIGDVVSGLRKRARPIGVDLSGPFFYPPRHAVDTRKCTGSAAEKYEAVCWFFNQRSQILRCGWRYRQQTE